MPAYPSAEESRDRLHRAGWSVRTRFDRWQGGWRVYADRLDQSFSAWGTTEARALANACRQAEALGLLDPLGPPDTEGNR